MTSTASADHGFDVPGREPRTSSDVRVLLADDHALIRGGIRALLEHTAGIVVVDEVDNGHDAVARAASLRPDLVLMDVAMPGLNGLEALAQIKRMAPETKVIILTMYANEEYVLEAVRSGAEGYLLKNARPAELRAALEGVMGGGSYLSPGVSEGLSAYVDRSRQPGDALAQLTPRQREILQLVAESKSTKEIAVALGISPKTVDMHRVHLMARLRITDVAGLVRFAIRAGLIGVDE